MYERYSQLAGAALGIGVIPGVYFFFFDCLRQRSISSLAVTGALGVGVGSVSVDPVPLTCEPVTAKAEGIRRVSLLPHCGHTGHNSCDDETLRTSLSNLAPQLMHSYS